MSHKSLKAGTVKNGGDIAAITNSEQLKVANSVECRASRDEVEQTPLHSKITHPSPSKLPGSSALDTIDTCSLRYRKRSLWLLAFYVPMLIIPWVMTCVLAIRPVNRISYIDQSLHYTLSDLARILFGLAAVRVLNAIASLVTIPLIGALLAQAAVTHTQRRRMNQAFTLRQTFALADRGWSDLALLWNASRKKGRGSSSRFLWWSAGLILLAVIQHPLQSLLVTTGAIQVPYCADFPRLVIPGAPPCDVISLSYNNIGWDPEPADLAVIPAIVVTSRVRNAMMTVSEFDVQARLWPDGNDGLSDSESSARQTLLWYLGPDGIKNFFVSNMINGTTTGVLREHAMRLNSSVECHDSTAFPDPCPGGQPFEASFSQASDLTISICVPGNFTASPYSLSRSRQDIVEDLYIDVVSPPNSSFIFKYSRTYTVHCKASTTRGYFELGNYFNDYQPGPLLDHWPVPQNESKDFNDRMGSPNSVTAPAEMDGTVAEFPNWALPVDPWGSDGFEPPAPAAPGPLTISAMTMFGSQSAFFLAANATSKTYPPPLIQICQLGGLPFPQLSKVYWEGWQDYCYNISRDAYQQGLTDMNDILLEMLTSWIFNFKDPDSARLALSTGMFLANEALLTQTAQATSEYGNARPIFSSPGYVLAKPQKSLASTIVISCLLGVELLALGYLAWYIYRVPTWTQSFDALSVATLAARSTDKDLLPVLGQVNARDLTLLEGSTGVVGVVEKNEEAGENTQVTGKSSGPALAVGALGIVKRNMAPWREKKKKESRQPIRD